MTNNFLNTKQNFLNLKKLSLKEYKDEFFFANLDAPEKFQMLFQDSASPIMRAIINFHHDLMFFIIIIVTLVSWILLTILYYDRDKMKLPQKLKTHETLLEIVWTVTPAIILILIAIPSFSLIYAVEEIITPVFTLKCIGHQWFWTYQYSFIPNHPLHKKESFIVESRLQLENELYEGTFRLLETQNPLYLPIKTNIRILVTSVDVLHSWAIPSLGLKIDACPGRLNQTFCYITRPGSFYGQCSEICGINHGFMPINIRAVTNTEFNSIISILYVYWFREVNLEKAG